jgi:3-methyladenine DNA glycosylase/8-oxoguanine DNA glycosylase
VAVGVLEAVGVLDVVGVRLQPSKQKHRVKRDAAKNVLEIFTAIRSAGLPHEPSVLRAGRSRDPEVQLCEMSEERRPEQPFCLSSLVLFLQRFPHPMGERVTASGEVARLFQDQDGDLVEVRILEAGPDSNLPITKFLQHKVEHVFELGSRVRAVLSEHSRADWLGPAVQLPVLRWDDSFAAMTSSIIEQQTSWRQALKSIDFAFTKSRRRKGWLSLFPSPEEFLERPEILEGMPITFRRKDLIRKMAGALMEEPDFLDALCTDLSRAESRLTSIKGIGPWTARVFLSKRFGYRRAVPTNDVALQRAAAHFICGEQRKMSEEELSDHLAEFGELAAEAAHRLLIRWVLETYPDRNVQRSG